MSVTATNLIQGPATLYVGDFGASETGVVGTQAAINNTPPASAWTDLGGTLDGVNVAENREFSEMRVDQVADVVNYRQTSRNAQVQTNLAEPTLDNLAYALNDTVSSTGSGGYKQVEPPGDNANYRPTARALLVEGDAPDETDGDRRKRRGIFRKVVSIDNVEFAYKRDEQKVFTVTWSTLYVSSSIKPWVWAEADAA